MRRITVVILTLLWVARAQEKYKLCATPAITEDDCNALQRRDSQVVCLRVTDGAECAIRLARDEADFGVFSAEELLLAYQFYPNSIQPIHEIRHQDRKEEEFEFQAVAVVPADLSPVGAGKGFHSLKNGGLCHPGFSKTQWWNDYILKFFERNTYNHTCNGGHTVAENEAENLKAFFGKSCRPGDWVTQESYDDYLKMQYPELCALCDNPTTCNYKSSEYYGHKGAIECLKSGRGKVAYVALNHVHEFISPDEPYQFLCKDGSVQSLDTKNPCAWIKQPWNVIATRTIRANDFANDWEKWYPSAYAGESWQTALRKTIVEQSHVAIALPKTSSLATYLGKGREVDLEKNPSCGKDIRWCTISYMEQNKCKWIAQEARLLGIEPKITCHETNSTFQCFRDIAENKADIITIDSNYGQLARKVYGLSTVLYSETKQDLYSLVVAVVRKPEESDNDPLISFKQLKGRKACFPEYDGIAWLSFMHTIRSKKIVSAKSCDYPKLVSGLLSGACAPGIKDTDHSNNTIRISLLKDDVSTTLCSACLSGKNNGTCDANSNNPYYGDKGALQCLSDGAGDIAFLEARNLIDTTIDTSKYQVLCKNDNLAHTPGFLVDDICALSVTIDSEVMSRRNNSKIDVMDISSALQKLEEWLGFGVNSRRPILMYKKFNDTENLLFKDSTSGLVPIDSQIKSVLAYKDLFKHAETCTPSSSSTFSKFGGVSLVALVAIFHGGARWGFI